jgi:single-stranded-DNA-specific exonuclease
VHWASRAFDPAVAERLCREANLDPVIARLLAQRGITSKDAAERFLRPRLDHLHPPELMRGMTVAIERVERAIANKENTLIYGDYDVDGTTAVVILKTCIELLGGVADFHVPHRIKEGYGIRDNVIEAAHAGGVTLVISVDTGIRAFEAAKTARRLGLDLIVTDHHLPESGEGVPDALAVLNPNQDGCDYPCKDICGAGVAFKLCQALLTRAGRERLIPSFLKMAAIATIADAVPLTGENRVIASLGLHGLRQPVNGGLRALMQVAELLDAQRSITATDVGFRLGPRINAAGRMDVAREVVELFTTKDEVRQLELARKLNELNTQRQEEERRILEHAIEQLDTDSAFADRYSVVLEGDGWHRGVIGIVATRIVERTGKPTLVISRGEDGIAHGSGRSIPAFHLLNALESADCRHCFIKFGGHAHAAGFSLENGTIAHLREGLERYARETLTSADFEPLAEIDGELSFADISKDLIQQLESLEPFGIGNPRPCFGTRNARLLQPVRVMKEKHAKLRLRDSDASRPYDVIGWRMREQIDALALVVGDKLDVVYALEENHDPEFGGIQLILKNAMRSAAAVGVSS